jgi:probable RNA-binding protein EIF1AD
MAGLGRRTHYRKHLTDSVLHDLPEPKVDERIAKVVSTRGGNQFDILLALSDVEKSHPLSERLPELAILPTKFHKLVWVKRNDYVIVQTAIEATDEKDDDDDDESKNDTGEPSSSPQLQEADKSQAPNKTKQDNINDGIRYIVTHILYKDQVKHLKSKGLWPINDPEFSSHGNDDNTSDLGDVQENEDGIVYTDGYYDEDDIVDDQLFVNTNRMARMEIQDLDDSSSEDDDT